jgi:hypothetical protein
MLVDNLLHRNLDHPLHDLVDWHRHHLVPCMLRTAGRHREELRGAETVTYTNLFDDMWLVHIH